MTISLVTCLSVCPHDQFVSHCTHVRAIWYVSSSWKSVKNIQVSLQYDNNNRYFMWSRPIYVVMIVPCWHLFKMTMFETNVIEKIKTHFMFNNFPKICHLWDNVVKLWYSQTGHRSEYDACWITNAIETHSEYAKHSFSMATVVRQTCLNITSIHTIYDRLCGLMVRVSGYRYRGPRFDSRRFQIFWVVGLERGPLSLVR
jgi:hypothetical protein